MGRLNNDLGFPGQKNQKKEVSDATFGSLNTIFGSCSYLNGFR